MGIDFKTKNIAIDDVIIKLTLWDTAGQEKFRPMIKNFYNKTKGAILVFDMTFNESLVNLQYWFE